MIPVMIMMFLCTLIPVFADSGPKPSLTIQCEGFPENSYVSVLSAVSHYGPNRPWSPEDHDDEYFIYDNFHPERLFYKGKLTRENLEEALDGALRCYPWEVLD
jgi:hypothetical protein